MPGRACVWWTGWWVGHTHSGGEGGAGTQHLHANTRAHPKVRLENARQGGGQGKEGTGRKQHFTYRRAPARVRDPAEGRVGLTNAAAVPSAARKVRTRMVLLGGGGEEEGGGGRSELGCGCKERKGAGNTRRGGERASRARGWKGWKGGWMGGRQRPHTTTRCLPEAKTEQIEKEASQTASRRENVVRVHAVSRRPKEATRQGRNASRISVLVLPKMGKWSLHCRPSCSCQGRCRLLNVVFFQNNDNV